MCLDSEPRIICHNEDEVRDVITLLDKEGYIWPNGDELINGLEARIWYFTQAFTLSQAVALFPYTCGSLKKLDYAHCQGTISDSIDATEFLSDYEILRGNQVFCIENITELFN